MKKIIGMGNALTDVLFQLSDNQALDHFGLPKGSMQLVDANLSQDIKDYLQGYERKMVAGGSAANTINGISCLGGLAAYIGKVGEDEIGDFFVNDTLHNGVKPVIVRSKNPSGNCTVLISPDGERTMCTYLGASCELCAGDLTEKLFADYDILHIEGYLVQSHALIETAVRMAKAQGLLVSIDLASYNVVEEHKEFLLYLIKEYVDIVFANEEEAKALTGASPREALDIIADMCEIAVVKEGAAGSYIKRKDKVWHIGAIPAKCVDTTGAGDLYASGFLFGLSCGFDLQRCGNLGALVSGKIVEVVGPKLPVETWNSIKESIQ